jgi:5'-nucleotidase
VVLSGINLGANTGRAVLHSGTVGAALTASLHGWRGLAVSLDSGLVPPHRPRWETVCHVLPEVFDVLLAAAEGTVLSLNVPDRPVPELRELREARLGSHGEVQVRVSQRNGADGATLHADFETPATPPEPGTDTALLRDGHPTITELISVSGRAGVLEEFAAGPADRSASTRIRVLD